jgi:tRNA threonylcarbamoyladenosine biosynthesis protein TsaB
VQHFTGPGVPASEAAARPMDEARGEATGTVIESPFPDIALLARFAATLDPAAYPPEALYIRDADAKPQERFRVARAGA